MCILTSGNFGSVFQSLVSLSSNWIVGYINLLEFTTELLHIFSDLLLFHTT